MYAAYGRIFTAEDLAWGILIDCFRRDCYDLIGAAIAIVNALVRSCDAPEMYHWLRDTCTTSNVRASHTAQASVDAPARSPPTASPFTKGTIYLTSQTL